MCLQEVELQRQCNKDCKTLTKLKTQEQRGRKVQANTMQSFDTREKQKELHVYDMCELSSMKACC